MNIQEQVAEKILDLQEKLLAAHPRMPVLLQEIHRTLKEYPECVTLLSEEQIGVIVSGLSQQTKVTISSAISTKGKGKAIKNIGVEDL